MGKKGQEMEVLAAGADHGVTEGLPREDQEEKGRDRKRGEKGPNVLIWGDRAWRQKRGELTDAPQERDKAKVIIG